MHDVRDPFDFCRVSELVCSSWIGSDKVSLTVPRGVVLLVGTRAEFKNFVARVLIL